MYKITQGLIMQASFSVQDINEGREVWENSSIISQEFNSKNNDIIFNYDTLSGILDSESLTNVTEFSIETLKNSMLSSTEPCNQMLKISELNLTAAELYYRNSFEIRLDDNGNIVKKLSHDTTIIMDKIGNFVIDLEDYIECIELCCCGVEKRIYEIIGELRAIETKFTNLQYSCVDR